MRLKEIKNGMVVHCKTQEEANQLCDAVGGSGNWKEYWIHNEDDTCYQILSNGISSYGKSISYGSKIITEFSDLILPELTAEEAIEWFREYYLNSSVMERVFGEDCSMAVLIKKYTAKEICDHISDWKSDHEKKEPEIETELIYQGRILEACGDGRFVQISGTENIYNTGCDCLSDAWQYMSEKLKEYCKEHEGEYVAKVERVCRVKAVG